MSAVPTDEIYEKYLQKAIAEINELGDEIARAAPPARVPVLGSGPPARGHLPAQAQPAAVGGPGGRRVLRPGRPGDPEVAPAAAGRPDGGVRHELPEVRGEDEEEAAPVAHARAPHRPAEARSSSWARTRSSFLNSLEFPLATRSTTAGRAPALHADGGGARRRRTSTRRSTSRRRRRASGTRSRRSGRGGRSCLRTEPRTALLAAPSRWPAALARVLRGLPRDGAEPADGRRRRCSLGVRAHPGGLRARLARAALRAGAGCSGRRSRSPCSRSLPTAAGLDASANFAKLAAVTAFGFWFLICFERVLWVVLVALLDPARRLLLGLARPDEGDHRGPPGGLHGLSFAFPVPGERRVPTSAFRISSSSRSSSRRPRVELRVGWTWLAMTLSFGATMAPATATTSTACLRLPLPVPRLPRARTPTCSGARRRARTPADGVPRATSGVARTATCALDVDGSTASARRVRIGRRPTCSSSRSALAAADALLRTGADVDLAGAGRLVARRRRSALTGRSASKASPATCCGLTFGPCSQTRPALAASAGSSTAGAATRRCASSRSAQASRSSSATASTCGVCGNMSTGRARTSR